jgi:hypothetical protein
MVLCGGRHHFERWGQGNYGDCPEVDWNLPDYRPAAFIARAGCKSTEGAPRGPQWSERVGSSSPRTSQVRCGCARDRWYDDMFGHTPDKLNDAAGGETGKAAKGNRGAPPGMPGLPGLFEFFESD